MFRSVVTEIKESPVHEKTLTSSKSSTQKDSGRAKASLRLSSSRRTCVNEQTAAPESESSDDTESEPSNSSSVATSRLYRRTTNNSVAKLPAFKGESDEKWKSYINRFEAVANYNGWSERDKLGQLLPRLQGAAGEFVYEELKSDILSNYKLLVKEIGCRFGTIETNKTYQTKFRSRDQKNGEPVQSYAAESKSLYSKAYPGRDGTTRQEDLISKFLLGLSSEKARLHVELNRTPSTIEEATRHVIEFEEATKYPRAYDDNDWVNRRKPTRQVVDEGPHSASRKYSKHSVETGDSSTSQYVSKEDLKSALLELKESLQPNKVKQKQGGPPKCFKCGEPGHYANKCQSEKTLKGARGSKPLDPQANQFRPSPLN